VVGIVVVTLAALLIARRTSTWAIDARMAGLSPACVALTRALRVLRLGLLQDRDVGVGSASSRG
jgi:hypothetical protein